MRHVLVAFFLTRLTVSTVSQVTTEPCKNLRSRLKTSEYHHPNDSRTSDLPLPLANLVNSVTKIKEELESIDTTWDYDFTVAREDWENSLEAFIIQLDNDHRNWHTSGMQYNVELTDEDGIVVETKYSSWVVLSFSFLFAMMSFRWQILCHNFFAGSCI